MGKLYIRSVGKSNNSSVHAYCFMEDILVPKNSISILSMAIDFTILTFYFTPFKTFQNCIFKWVTYQVLKSLNVPIFLNSSEYWILEYSQNLKMTIIWVEDAKNVKFGIFSNLTLLNFCTHPTWIGLIEELNCIYAEEDTSPYWKIIYGPINPTLMLNWLINCFKWRWGRGWNS